MAEADSGSGPVSLFPVSNKLQARMNTLKEVIESQKSEVSRIRREMRRLIEKKENEIIKELDSIWDETNTRIGRKKEEVQKRIEEIEIGNKEMEKTYDKMTKLLREMNQTLPPLPQISEAIESAKRELDISIPHLNLSWRVDVLRESINRMCRVEQTFRDETTPFCLEKSMEKENTVTDQAENKINELFRKEEKERRLEMELDEWKNRNRILEQSIKKADNEKEILKREIDQLKSKLRGARTKQTNAQQVDELKLSLVKAKKEMEVLRAETKERLKQSEQLEQERKNQDLEKLKQAKSKVESYKRSASRNTEEREIAKFELEAMTRGYEEHKQKYADTMRDLSQVMAKLKQTEEDSKRLKSRNEFLEQRLRDLDKPRRQDSNKFELRASKFDQTPSFGSFLNQNSPEENVSETESRFYTPDCEFSLQNQLPPSYSSHSVKADSAGSEDTSIADLHDWLKYGAENEVLQWMDDHSIPGAVPRFFRQPSSSDGDGIQLYNPDVLTVFLNKTQPLIYNASSIKTTILSHLKNPDSHLSKQVLVKIKAKFKLGNLKVVFSKMHVYFKKTEMMAGILLQEPVGISNGVFESIRHFDCPDNHAVFVLINEVYVPLI